MIKHFEQQQRLLRKAIPIDNQVQPMLGDGFRNEYTPGIQPRQGTIKYARREFD